MNLPLFEWMCRRLSRRHVRALMYHRFSRNGDEHTVGHEVLGRQLDYIARHHEAWDPDRQLDFYGQGAPAPRRPAVVITVDDGYHDFYDVAFPLLVDHDLTATLFVTTGFVDGRNWFWWDQVAYLLEQAAADTARLASSNQLLHGDLEDPTYRRLVWTRTVSPLRFLPNEEKKAGVKALADDLGIDLPEQPPRKFAAATWAELREMAGRGIRIAAHTVTHPILSRVDHQRAHDEIFGSKQELFDNDVDAINWFCYPQGGPVDYTPEIVEMVEQAGYRGCYVAFYNPRDRRNDFELSRTAVSENFTHFRWNLCGAEYLFMRLKGKLGLNVRAADAGQQAGM